MLLEGHVTVVGRRTSVNPLGSVPTTHLLCAKITVEFLEALHTLCEVFIVQFRVKGAHVLFTQEVRTQDMKPGTQHRTE